MSIIGVDYGGLNVTTAYAAGMSGGAKQRGGIKIVLNEGSGRFTPNLATFEGEQRNAGAMAKTKERSNYKNTVCHVKRLIGRKYSDPYVQRTAQRLHYKIVQTEKDQVGIVVQFEGKTRTFLPEQIVAYQLANVKAYSEEFTKLPVNDIVVSVPMYFTEDQRRAMLDACDIAGIRCYRVVNDTTATALCYGILRKKSFEGKPANVMFLDMGYNDFQVAIVQFTQTGLRVRGQASDANLGGHEFDIRLAGYLNDKFMEKHKTDLRTQPKSWIKLLQAAEKAKKTMSPKGVNKARISIECLYRETDFRYVLTIEELEDLVKDMMPRVADTIQRALDSAGMKKEELSSCEATGGSIRMRFVKNSIAAMLGEELMSYTMNQDECTARGCAILCAMLSPKVKVSPYEIQDAVDKTVKLTWESQKNDGSEKKNSLVIFKKGDAVPKDVKVTFKRTKTFTLSTVYEDGQSQQSSGEFKIDMTNASDAVAEALKVGDKPEVRVYMSCDASGIVSVGSAEYMKKNKQPVEEEEEEEEEEQKPQQQDAEKTTDKNEQKKEDEAADGEKDTKKDEGSSEKDASNSSEKADASSASDSTTAPDAKKAKTEEKPKKKKKKKKVPKYTKIQLSVTRESSLGLPRKTISQLHDEEMKMQQAERLLKERDEARNALESYVYSIRDSLEDENLQPFMPSNFKEDFGKKLEEMEDWLYTEEGFDSAKSVFVAKLQELRKPGDAIKVRFDEFTKRPAALKSLAAAIDTYRTRATTEDDSNKHWDDADRKVLTDACDKAETWMKTVTAALESLPQFADPTTTVAQIEATSSEIHSSCLPVITKPVPKPKEEPKEEAKKDESGSDDKDKSAAEGKSDGSSPMETDDDDAAKTDATSAEDGEPMDTGK